MRRLQLPKLDNNQRNKFIHLTSMLDIALKDDVPEIEEVFIVQLDSVNLVGGATPDIPPSLGANTIAEVIVAPNDSPQGIITFAQDM